MYKRDNFLVYSSGTKAKTNILLLFTTPTTVITYDPEILDILLINDFFFPLYFYGPLSVLDFVDFSESKGLTYQYNNVPPVCVSLFESGTTPDSAGLFIGNRILL